MKLRCQQKYNQHKQKLLCIAVALCLKGDGDWIVLFYDHTLRLTQDFLKIEKKQLNVEAHLTPSCLHVLNLQKSTITIKKRLGRKTLS